MGIRSGDVGSVMKKKTVVYILTIILSAVYLFVASKAAIGDGRVFGQTEDTPSVRAKFLRITDKEDVSY